MRRLTTCRIGMAGIRTAVLIREGLRALHNGSAFRPDRQPGHHAGVGWFEVDGLSEVLWPDERKLLETFQDFIRWKSRPTLIGI